MNGTPSQAEIDAVAHFIEAVRELRQSRFFVEEYRSLTISNVEECCRFPDPETLQSILVPFRRVWHQGEPCYHRKVSNILMRYVPEWRDFLEPLLFDDSRSLAWNFEWAKNSGLSPADVINLWLNTRYHHVGKSARGQFTREDFDRFKQTIGSVRFEYYFLETIFKIGISFFNILQCAERFLFVLAADGHRPSFVIEADKGSVQRLTPGFTPKNTPEHWIWRLRRRRQYEGFNYLLEIIDVSNGTVAELVSVCDTFDTFAAEHGIVFEHTDNFHADVEKMNFTHADGCLDNEPAAFRNGRCRRGFVARRENGSLVWGEDYLPVLRDQYLEFRNAFMEATKM